MSLEQQKVFKANFLPSRLRRSFPIYNEQFNDLIDAIIDAIAAVGGAPVPGAPHVTDTVNEFTSGAGVTIDGVLIKDGGVQYDTGGATQAGTIASAVTVNKPAGNITTLTATNAVDASVTFTLNNSFITTSKAIIVSILDYSGTYGADGTPVVSLDNRGSGTVDVIITNSHGTNALNGALKISFLILN